MIQVVLGSKVQNMSEDLPTSIVTMQQFFTERISLETCPQKNCLLKNPYKILNIITYALKELFYL